VKIVRIILLILVTGVFIFLAKYLYDRQQNKYAFESFSLGGESTDIFVPNLDRLLDKLNSSNDITSLGENPILKSGLDQLIFHKNTSFNEDFGEACFVSFTATDFSLAFTSPGLNFDKITQTLTKVFNLKASYSNHQLTLSGQNYYAQQYGLYTVISTRILDPNPDLLPALITNADYIVTQQNQVQKYVIAQDRLYKIWNTTADTVRGGTLRHAEIIKKVPNNFNSIDFYGSTQMEVDKYSFFGKVSNKYDWIGNELVILHKDSFQLMIVAQNENRDLRLILEEQTLGFMSDSAQISHLSIKNFRIMPFKSNFNWQEAFPVLTNQLTHFTEFENYNILASSFEAMNWYLSEIQIEELLTNDEMLYENYQLSLPLSCHTMHIEKIQGSLEFTSATWRNKTQCTRTATIYTEKGANDSVSDVLEFNAAFVPTDILSYQEGETSFLVLANNQNIAVYDHNNALVWNVQLPDVLVAPLSFVDLDKNGKKQIVAYTKTQLLVLNADGKVRFSKSANAANPIKGGLTVIYEDANQYRFFVISANNIQCFGEKGEVIQGWKYTGKNPNFTGQATYNIVEGADILSFSAADNQIHLLNRKGESRYATKIFSKLQNQSEFIAGKNETTLSKLGFSNPYIYTRFLKDNFTDSVKLDVTVSPISAKWVLSPDPTLIVEESNRILQFNPLGFVKSEVIKPEIGAVLVDVLVQDKIYYVLTSNSDNSIYLLNGDGKLLLSKVSLTSKTFGLIKNKFYISIAQMIQVHKLN
jgi:hypothetical protein